MGAALNQARPASSALQLSPHPTHSDHTHAGTLAHALGGICARTLGGFCPPVLNYSLLSRALCETCPLRVPIFRPSAASGPPWVLLSCGNECVPILWGKMDGGWRKEEEIYIDYLSYIKFIVCIIAFNSQTHGMQLRFLPTLKVIKPRARGSAANLVIAAHDGRTGTAEHSQDPNGRRSPLVLRPAACSVRFDSWMLLKLKQHLPCVPTRAWLVHGPPFCPLWGADFSPAQSLDSGWS